MHFITILISMIGCGTAFECNFCDRTPFSVECKGEIVCPLDAQNVKVQCEIEKIISSDIILQLMITGPGCRPVEHYAHFCFENNIKEIILLDTSEKPLYCAGKKKSFLSITSSFLSTPRC